MPPKFFGWAFIGFGILWIILLGLGDIVPPVTASVGRTEGVVVRQLHDEGPIAEYEYQVGGKSFIAKVGTQHVVGEKVPIVYKADDPAVAAIDTFSDRWQSPAQLIAVGAFIVVIGVLLFWMPVTAAKPGPLADKDVEQIQAALLEGKKVEAIKLYKIASGTSLMESKRFVEKLEQEMKPGKAG